MTKRVIAAMFLLAAPAALLLCVPAWCAAAPPAPQQQRAQAQAPTKPTLGAISGKVTDARGIPQMGALVVVLAADGRVLRKIYTNEVGAFMQDRLVPGVYSLRVSLASFLPAVRDSIGVKAGSQNFLSINLSSLTDTLTGLINTTPHQDSDSDWKWVIRSSGGLRPVLRILPGQSGSVPALARVPGGFSEDGGPEAYRGRLEMAAGGSGSQGFGADADFSTRFSLAQTLFADTTLLLGGNLGFGTDSLSPASAFRGVLRSDAPDGSSNQLSVTIRQIVLPTGFVSVPSRGGDTFMASSADFERTTMLTDRVSLIYGSSYDSLLFMGHVSSINPHGKIVAKITPNSLFQISYSQGPERERRAQDAFASAGGSAVGDPLRDVSDQLTVFPQVSLRSGSPAIERDRRVEAAYRIALDKKTTVEAALYRDQISDFSIGVAGQASQFRAGISDGQLLPDVFSNTATLNGGFQNLGGGRVAIRRQIGDYVEATAAYSMAALPVPGLRTNLSDDLSNLATELHNERRQSLAAKIGVQAPRTGTKVIASYKWMSGLAILPRDPYSDSIGQVDANFNIVIHQPLPQLTPFMGHVEAVAEVRNLLSQGYIPLVTADGRKIYLLQNVKSFRGGFAVNF